MTELGQLPLHPAVATRMARIALTGGRARGYATPYASPKKPSTTPPHTSASPTQGADDPD